MNKQLNMFDGTKYDKVNQAIKLIQEFEEASVMRNPLGYVVGYSGGKDSEVLVDLFIRSGVKFIVIHNHTGLDAPETVYFIRKKFKHWKEQGIDCRIYYPEKTFWQLCKEYKMLPTGIARFCCAELKERKIPELKFATHSFGVRKTESVKRSLHRDSIETRNTESFETKSDKRYHFDNSDEVKETGACYTNKYFIVNPIAYWTEDEVWDYIHERKIEYNPLYDKGWKRIGCIGCPMAGKDRFRQFKEYPKYEKLYRKLADEIDKTTPNRIRKDKNGKSYSNYFDWWING